MRRLFSAALASSLIWAAAPAFAQDAKSEETKPAADAQGEGPKRGKMSKAGFSRVSDNQETIYSVQRKAFLINGKLEINPAFSATFTDRFVQSYGGSLSVAYHLSETFGIELFGTFQAPDESELTTEILERGNLEPELAKLSQMSWAAGAGFQWSPIYGKLQMAGTSLGNFSFFVGAGLAVGQTRVQCTPNRPVDPNRGFNGLDTNANGQVLCPVADIPAGTPASEASRFLSYEPYTTKLMGTLSGGVRFDFNNWLGLKFEVKDYIFPARVYRPSDSGGTGGASVQGFTDAIRNNLYAQVGVSFLLFGEDN